MNLKLIIEKKLGNRLTFSYSLLFINHFLPRKTYWFSIFNITFFKSIHKQVNHFFFTLHLNERQDPNNTQTIMQYFVTNYWLHTGTHKKNWAFNIMYHWNRRKWYNMQYFFFNMVSESKTMLLVLNMLSQLHETPYLQVNGIL